MSTKSLEIHVIADSTAESAMRLVRAAMMQFPTHQFTVVRHRRMTSTKKMISALDALRARAGMPTAVMATLVDGDLVELVKSACRELDFPFVDLMSDALHALERITGAHADQVPMRPVGVEADYFVRIAAIDFAVRMDDGSLPEALGECDICLVGPSRSGKTPLSIYLAYLGYKAVNVPLIPGIAPPRELYALDRWRIMGLTMNAERLMSIRGQRVRGMGGFGTKDGYADLAKIYDELDEIATIHRRFGCPVIDMTGLALEEAASRIIDMVDQRAQRVGARLRRPPGVITSRP